MNVPVEFNMGGIYMPPMFIAALLGVITAMAVGRLLNSYRLSKYFFYPPLAFVSLTIIFMVTYGITIIPF